MSKATVTTNHDEIRRWAEERNGRPASIKGTGGRGEPGVLRIHFHDDGELEEDFERVSWDAFFEKFDEEELGFLHQDVTAEGRPSRFHKFVNRDGADTSH